MRRLAAGRSLKILDLYRFDRVGKRIGWWSLGGRLLLCFYIYNQKGRCGSSGPRRRRPQLTLNCVLALCISLPALRGPDVK